MSPIPKPTKIDLEREKELGLELTRQEFRFNYSFAGLILSALALSIQFSPKYGYHLAVLLMLSWVLQFAAAIVSCFLIQKKLNFLSGDLFVLKRVLRMDATQENIKTYRTTLKALDEKMINMHAWRLWLFLVGIGFNLLFAMVNYLIEAHVFCFCY